MSEERKSACSSGAESGYVGMDGGTAELADDGATCNRLRRFERWMDDRRFKPPAHLRIAQFTGTLGTDCGLGMLTTKALTSGQPVLCIPEALLVTIDTVLTSETVGRHMRTFNCGPAGRLTSSQALCAFLMCESLRTDSSPFEPYLSMMPVAYTTPPFLPKAHLRHFSAHVQRKIGDQKRKLKAEYECLRPFLEHLAVPKVLDFRLFLWARFSLTTRAVYLQFKPYACDLLAAGSDCQALAPFLDFLNHSCDAKVKAGFNEVTRTYDVVTLQDVAARSQVFVSYGPHDNVTLLLEYGFVVPHNPHSVVEFSPDDIEDCCLRVFGDGFIRRKVTAANVSLSQGDFGCTWDGPTWGLTSTLKRIIRDLRHESLSDMENTLQRLLQLLMTRRLEKASQMQCRSRSSSCSRPARCLASTMSSILMQEEIDILKKHIPGLDT